MIANIRVSFILYSLRRGRLLLKHCYAIYSMREGSDAVSARHEAVSDRRRA